MANKYTQQVLTDTNTHTIIKLTGVFDGTSIELNNTRIQANTLNFALDSSKANLLSAVANTGANAYYGLSVDRVWYNSSASVELYWSSTASSNTILNISTFGTGSYNAEGNWVSIPNNAKGQVGCLGDIGVKSLGAPAANTSYNIIISLRKDNADYSRGQHADPSAFNYGEYAMKPGH